ncbi:hypothetical protein CRE_30589 [Caenorhabditis remanei]|uniref:SEC7 domain-containing protein n=1 Tax=Caenorhabditis remanei TaxID=31234 RepID=E3NRK0_CAERE|nr:hypothetical protein CRE_30589 [Caenorhabditis remanei]
MRDTKEWRGTTSTSRVFVQKGYQLSDELALRKVQVLERRYGGTHLAHRAATIIQRAWRDYCLMKQWMVIRHKHDTIPDHLDARCGVSNSQRNELSLTSRYATSLSAQLRIDRAARSNTVDRSPPSPAPPVLANLQNSNMIVYYSDDEIEQINGWRIYWHTSFTYHSLVLKYFTGMIDIRGLEVDVALRKAMQFFILPKEAEKIDRIIQAFALHYSKSNPKRTSNFRGGWDTIHLLSFAIIMLNTDLHSPNVKQRMTQADFVKNLRGQDKISGEKNGEDIDRKTLEGIYDRIKKDELKAGDDHVAQVQRVDRAIVGKDKPRLTETPRRLVCYCRLQQVSDPTKRQSSTARERDVFLFNDMIVVAKGVRRGSTSMAGCTYTLKQWTVLLGAHVTEFQRGQYEFGLTITCPNKDKIHFNARNFEDRCHFVADVTESIREATEMEQVRLEMEMEHHTTIRSDNQRDSGLPDMDESMKLSNGSNSSAGSSNSSTNGVNGSSFRRLSFNSLDSGVVEEHLDAC